MEINLNKLQQDVKKLVDSFQQEVKIYAENVKLLKDKNVTFSKEQKQHTEKQIENTKKRIDSLQNEKVEMDKLLTEITNQLRTQQAQQIIDNKGYVEENKAVDQDLLASKKMTVNEVIAIQKKLGEETEKIGKQIVGGATGQNKQIDEQAKAAEKASKKVLWKTAGGWEALSGKIGKAKESAGAALNSMFGAMTKDIDQDIASKKEKIENINKELAKLNTDHSLVLNQAKEQAKKDANKDIDGDEEGDKDNRKTAATAEIEELERLYNLQEQMKQVNQDRQKAADGAAYEEIALSEEQQKSLDALSQKHLSYAQALKDKTIAEKDEQARHNQLTKEKEGLEEMVKKKEKQKKKVEASQQFIQAGINIAEGITKALALGPIVGHIMAGVVAAAGTMQLVAISKNISKLEDGGLLRGKRHSQGGMPILGSNMEVEGGEYVVNRDSTRKNLGLIRYINSQRRELSPTDLSSYFSTPLPSFEPPFNRMFQEGGQVPVMESSVDISNWELLSGIEKIRIEPRVSVTDINTVQQDMVRVDEWTGL